MTDADILARLTAHRAIGGVPREELEWLIAHGTLERYQTGELFARKGHPVPALYIILSGRVSHLNDQTGAWRTVIQWKAGDVTGQLPYSRLNKAPGNSVVDETTEVFQVPLAAVAEMPVAVPHVTAELVHVMVDRARAFKSSDLQQEKMASLGKLAAGVAHELNNPASAAARSAKLVASALDESDDAARALGAAALDARESALIDRVRDVCVDAPRTRVLTPLERSDREETFADWMADHDLDDTIAAALADTELKVEALDELARTLSGEKLSAALRWLAARCSVRALTRDIERAASRVHDLVSAVKGVTHMDRAAVPEPVDIAKTLTDTIAVLAYKARQKSVSLTVEAPTDLPHVRGFVGELSQVWMNLIDNALDAVNDGGRVAVSAMVEGSIVAVRVIDDGPGISDELRGKIFDAFFTTKPPGKGTGLGLDIVNRLVAQNNGRIDLESKPGQTEFRVTLPGID